MSWRIRNKDAVIPKGQLTPNYDSGELFFVRFHHSGKFVNISNREKLKYVGGKKTIIDYVDRDLLSIIEVHSMVKEIGHNPIVVNLYMSIVTGEHCDGLLVLKEDYDVRDMRGFAGKDRCLGIYVDHMRKDPKGIACYINGEVQKDKVKIGKRSKNVVDNGVGTEDAKTGEGSNTVKKQREHIPPKG